MDVGNGITGNGTLAAHKAHNWKGRGVLQIKHQVNYDQFASYIAINHPELVTNSGGKTTQEIKQLLMDNTKQITDVDTNPNSYLLSVLAGAWYWASNVNRAGHNLNLEADNLTAIPSNDITAFRAVSEGIATDVLSYNDRFRSYVAAMTLVQAVGNPYESMQDVLARMGIKSNNAFGYEKQFGINLSPRTLKAIDPAQYLLVADASVTDNSMPTTEPALSVMQDLLAQAKIDLNLQPGEFAMLISDMPAAPPQTAPIVMIAQVNQAQKSTKQTERVLA